MSQGSGVFQASSASLSEETSASRRANQDRSGSPLCGSLQRGVMWPGTARSSSPSRLLSSSDLTAQHQPQGLLVQKVEGIISSVHQTLGALEAKSQAAEPAGRPGQVQPFPMVAGPPSARPSRAQSAAPSAPVGTQCGGASGLLISGGQCPAQPPPAQVGTPGMPAAVTPSHNSSNRSPSRMQLGIRPGAAELTMLAERLTPTDAMSDTAMSRSSAPAALRSAWGPSPRSSQASPHSSSYGSPVASGLGRSPCATARLQPSRAAEFGLGSAPSAPLRGETVAACPAPVWQSGQGSPTAGLRGR